MKKKFIVIIALLGLLVFTVLKMMKFEESIRKDHIITKYVEDDGKPLIKKINNNEIAEIMNDISVKFRTDRQYFQQKQKDSVWQNILLKGVNLGVAVPGKFPAEFSLSFEQYLKWFVMIGNMNSNVIRVYTILPPDFYKALSYYNLHNLNKPLYVMHGVWAKVPNDEDYFNKEYTREFQKEIIDVLNVVHGKANLKAQAGKASGVYTVDVSDYIVGYLLGREWEPKSVFHTIKEHTDHYFNGSFVSLPQGNPMEVWLAKMMDFATRYETQNYAQQHPISFVNWLPLDPMYHNTEYIENKKVREYDNDLLQIDFTKFNPTKFNKAGIYAAYHVYPYYPDFIYMKKNYSESINKEGEKDNFYGYLNDLKQHTKGLALVIAEYGLPTSRGISHFTPSGFNQGGHNELEQASKSLSLTKDIFDTGCAGAIYFEWADEWFKHNWLVMDFENPFHNRKIWHNMENPEQNFGILALEDRSKIIDAQLNDWKNIKSSWQENNTKIYTDTDATYFYIASKLPDLDFNKHNLYIAIDTYNKEKGDKKLPFSDRIFENGFEFLCSFKSLNEAKIQVDEKYSVFTDIYNDNVPVYASKPNKNGIFIDELMLVNRGRNSLTGQKFDSLINNRSILTFGKSNRPETSNTDWYWDAKTKLFELRLDWHLINVSDPSHKYVLDDKKNTRAIEVSQTDGFRIYLFITDKNNNILHSFPKKEPIFTTWNNWKKPKYTERLKPIYNTLQKYFYKVKTPLTKDIKSTQKNKIAIAHFYNNKKGAISFSFNDGGYSQYQYAFPLINKYKLNGTFSALPKQMDNMPGIVENTKGIKTKLMGYNQLKDILAKDNEIALQTAEINKTDLLFTSLNRPASVIHFTGKKTVLNNNKIFVRNTILHNKLSSTYQYNGIFYKLINAQNTAAKIDSILHKNTDKWSIISFKQIYKDSTELHNIDSMFIKNNYLNYDTFKKQIRLARNTAYWIAPESVIYKYLYEKKHSKIITKRIGNQLFITIENLLNPTIFNQALSINYHTSAKMIKVSGSITDGYYTNKLGYITFNAKPNQMIKLEIIN